MEPVICDEALIRELDFPDSDTRCGVNVICRPSEQVVAAITSIQDGFRAREPRQYYYPAADLHLTVSEIIHSRTYGEATEIGERLTEKAWTAFGDFPAFDLNATRAVFDERAGRLELESKDGRLHQIRQRIHDVAMDTGIVPNPRYRVSSAHITFMRYICPLRTEIKEWSELTGQPWPVARSWNVSELFLTWGANWFGMRPRITERGPCRLGG